MSEEYLIKCISTATKQGNRTLLENIRHLSSFSCDLYLCSGHNDDSYKKMYKSLFNTFFKATRQVRLPNERYR